MTAYPEGDAASPAGDAVSPTGDLLAPPNFGICDTTRQVLDLILPEIAKCGETLVES